MARKTNEKLRVVLDTNILVSSRIARGNEFASVQLAIESRFELFVSQLILDEFSRAVTSKLRWTTEQLSAAVSEILSFSELVNPPALAGSPTGHPPDDHILACAVAADADFLVTGDKRHLLPLGTFGRTRIVTAAEFILELEQADGYAAH